VEVRIQSNVDDAAVVEADLDTVGGGFVPGLGLDDGAPKRR
jgi:hypothetical protein